MEVIVIDRASPFLAAVPQRMRERLTAIVGERTSILHTGVVAKVRALFTKRSTGRLAGSVQEQTTSTAEGATGRVYSEGVPYARIWEYGGTTRPHVIEAKNGKSLAFMGRDGKMVFVRKVNHPGSRIPERSYARSTLAEQRAEIVRTFIDGISGVLR